MTTTLTSEQSFSEYIMREATEDDMEAMVTLFNHFASCKLYRTLYPDLEDATQLSATNRRRLSDWIHSPSRRLNVLIHTETQEVVAFCQWALDSSADLPYGEKYYQGLGSDIKAIKSFLDAIGDYDDKLCLIDNWVYLDWLVIAKEHQRRGLLAILLSWGWRYSVLNRKLILLDPIEETVAMWKKIGCVELTGSRAQLRWNHLKHGEKVDEDSIPSEENPRFHSYIVGSDRTGQTVIQPLIANLYEIGQYLSKSKWLGRGLVQSEWRKSSDLNLGVNEITEYMMSVGAD